MLAVHLRSLPFVAVIEKTYSQITALLERYAAPVLDLAVRLWMARIFFNSGRTKIADWDSTVFLFEEEYKVPLLPPEAAAGLATTFELCMPVLLVLGLATRLAALPLLGMALVIQFALGASDSAYDNIEHYYWMFLSAMIVLRGPGTLSLDHLLGKKVFGPRI